MQRVLKAWRACRDDAEGLAGSELAHLFSVWLAEKLRPSCVARCHRRRSKGCLSARGADCSHSGQLRALPPVQGDPVPQLCGPAARLLQILDPGRGNEGANITGRQFSHMDVFVEIHERRWV